LPAVCWQSCSACPQGTNLSGTIVYDNTAQSTLSNCQVSLLDGQGTAVQTATTNASGQYSFSLVPAGTYTISTATGRTWGGVNSTDALNVARHFSNTQLLAGIRVNVADVNASNSINATDALQISRRTVSLISSFAAGNWYFQRPSVTLSGGSVQQAAIKGLCVGDVNGSFNPGARTSPGVSFVTGRESILSLNANTVALAATQSIELGAVTLHIRYPESWGAAQFRSDVLSGNLIWNQESGVLHVSWYDLAGTKLTSGEVLGEIVFENPIEAGDFSSIMLTDNSELANTEAEPIAGAVLRLLGAANAATFSAVAYPNPSRGVSNLRVNLPNSASVRYVLTDMSGRMVTASDWSVLPAGLSTLAVEVPSAGQYLLQVTSVSDTGRESQTLRITRLP
jgi:hypothetical protein